MDLTGPCNWPTTGCPDCGDECGAMTAAQRAEYQAWAINDLWEATGRVYGTCTVTVMPCNDWGVLCGACWSNFRGCACVFVPEVKLPGPVASVTEVVIDGVALDPDAYRIDDYQWLVRTDGDTWPTNTDYLDPDAFSVTYEAGIAPPAGAGIVTGMVMCSRSACTTSGCKVPRETTQVTRQGVTMLRFPIDAPGAMFGIPAVDQWVRNANQPLRGGAVYSPDLPQVRRTTWQATTSP